MTITPPIRNKIVGTSPKIKYVNPMPKIGNKEYEGKICPTV